VVPLHSLHFYLFWWRGGAPFFVYLSPRHSLLFGRSEQVLIFGVQRPMP